MAAAAATPKPGTPSSTPTPLPCLQNKDCDGCYLYNSYSAKAPLSTRFVYSPYSGASPPDVANVGHVLVMPREACRGVEDWRSHECGREDIW